MPVAGSDQLRCSLVQDHTAHDSINYVMSRLDGTLIEEVEIGGEEWPYSYPAGQRYFTWKFIDHTPDMRIKTQTRALQEAFNSVQQITALIIDYAPDRRKTDFTIEWLEEIESFDNKLSVLAHAYLYHPNSKKNGVMEFNDSPESKWYFTALGWPVEAYLVDNVNFKPGQQDANGRLIMRASQPTVKIAMHELGHILGLRHDTLNVESLMYPHISQSYIDGTIIKPSFYWDSVSSIPRLQERYDSSNILWRWLERWRGRRTRESTYRRYD